ncbi:hypothetical protein ACFXO9_26780 [Nocardia tengchongensis]|uniref:hypothetical protein n=1 Tax=Nocardia tengchongensis TaxID=2055889 RepID=UPI0036B31955
MTGPNQAPSAREIPADQITLLQRIQELALQSGQLLQHMYGTGGHARTAVQTISDINALDRDRDLTEIRAHAAGVPAEWIDRVRTLGQRGYPWRDDQPLPDPAPRARRRSIRRVAEDVEQLKDMAAVHAAYLRTRPGGEPDTDMEHAVTQQLHRNMAALWMRAGRTAESIGMSAKERAVLWAVAPTEWQQRVHHYAAGDDLGELHTRWRRHGDVTIATDARKALNRMRRAGHHGPEVPLPDMPMSPRQMLREADAALTAVEQTDGAENIVITAAIEAALPEELTVNWSAESHHHLAAQGYENEPRLDSEPET